MCSIDVQSSIPSIPTDLQRVIDNNSKVFGEILKGLSPTQDHDHALHLQQGSVPPDIRPYMYRYAHDSWDSEYASRNVRCWYKLA